ncbi:MAG: B12-binding domain-containing radical SAM protein [bacterium]
MNILFIYPTKLDKNGNIIKYKKAFLPPLSLAILNSLTPVRHNVKIVNDIVEDISFSSCYDLVAITSMTMQIKRAYQIADRFRCLGTKVIIGGFHATILPEEAKKHADSVVIGEADNLWEQILSDFENNNFKEFYQDTSFPDLQKLVIPKWDNMNLKIYPKPIGYRLPMMPLFTTRGCVFSCRFCSVSKFFGKTYRFKPISNVIKEIDSINTKAYIFVDDNISCNVDYSRELFKALSHKKIRWLSQISTSVLKTPALIDLAAKSGCNSLFIGIESINNKNLKSINKGFNKAEEYEELFTRLRKVGIIPFPSIIFGLDYDTPDQLKLTLDFLMKNKIGYALFWILTPLPGTDLFNDMNKEGRILDNNWSMYDLSNVIFQPKNFTTSELYMNYWKTYQKFYSLKNIAKRMYYNISISAHPFYEFFDNLFYQFYFRKKVNLYDPPISGGINRVNPS